MAGHLFLKFALNFIQFGLHNLQFEVSDELGQTKRDDVFLAQPVKRVQNTLSNKNIPLSKQLRWPTPEQANPLPKDYSDKNASAPVLTKEYCQIPCGFGILLTGVRMSEFRLLQFRVCQTTMEYRDIRTGLLVVG